MRPLPLIFLALMAAACGGKSITSGTSPDASPDSGGGDASTPDSSGNDAHPDVAGEDVVTTSDASTGSDSATTRIPKNHRPDDSACMAIPAPGTCVGGDPEASCSTDGDCTMGTNGRCDNDGPLPGCHCDYDICPGDSACPTGETCACHDTPYVAGGNACVPGNCRVDADCGTNGFCSPSVNPKGCGEIGGYYCHTAADTCIDDPDCAPEGACAYDQNLAHWDCAKIQICG